MLHLGTSSRSLVPNTSNIKNYLDNIFSKKPKEFMSSAKEYAGDNITHQSPQTTNYFTHTSRKPKADLFKGDSFSMV